MSTGVSWARRVLPAIAMVVCTLSGCGGGPTHSHVSSAVTRHFKGLPKGVSVPDAQREGASKPWAAWAGPHSIYVMTWGSGSCPKIPTSVKVEDSDRIVASTVEHDFYARDTVCTADLAVTTSVVQLPSAVSDTKDLLVEIDGTATRLGPRIK